MYDPARLYDPATFWEQMSDEDYPIKKQQRNDRVDKRAKMKQDFMKVNSAGLKKQILPLIGKKSREAKEGKK